MSRQFPFGTAPASGAHRTRASRRHWPQSIVAVVGVATLLSCGDFSTAPDMRPSRRPQLDLSTDPQWGKNSSPNSGSWSGDVDGSWDGHAPAGPGWYFPYKTIIVVTTSGTVSQQAGGYPATGIVWRPWGRPGSDLIVGGAIGLQITNTGGGSSVWWPQAADSSADTTSNSTIAVRYQARPFRDGVRDPQPDNGPVEYNCGRSSNPRWPCYTYPGTAQLSFTRPHVGLTMTKSGATTARTDSIVTFTAGMTIATIAGLAVDMSEVHWKWVSDAPASGDTLTCESAVGLTCSHRVMSSGVMYLSAYVNGEQQQKSIQVDIEDPDCKDSPELADFPYLKDPNVQQGLRNLWRDSKYSPDSLDSSRRESGGWIIRNADGTFRFEPFVYGNGIDHGPCWSDTPEPSPGLDIVATVHTQPFKAGDSYSACGDNSSTYKNNDGSWMRYRNEASGSGKPKQKGDFGDLEYIAEHFNLPNIEGLILDQDGFVTYDLTDLIGGPAPGKPKVPGHKHQRCGY